MIARFIARVGFFLMATASTWLVLAGVFFFGLASVQALGVVESAEKAFRLVEFKLLAWSVVASMIFGAFALRNYLKQQWAMTSSCRI